MSKYQPLRPQLIPEPLGIMPDGRSYCANSDLFTHNLLGLPRDLPDEVYRDRADFFHHLCDDL